MSVEHHDLQVEQIQSAIQKVVAVGPDFLNKKVSADDMAHTMVNAVQDYAKQAEKEGAFQPKSNKAGELLEVIQEIMACGSGYLAQRCDADCVARTIATIVDEFPEKPTA